MAAPQDPGADFELVAAGLRADGEDVRLSLEVLAGKLEAALPGRTTVERSGGGLLGRGPRRVRRLEVSAGGCRYQLEVGRGEQLACGREREVGGISIKRERLEPERWVASLAEELRAEAEQSEQARAALATLLG